jgi:hypothetical protein
MLLIALSSPPFLGFKMIFLFIDVDNVVVNLSTSETFDKNLKSIYPNVLCAYNIVHNLMIHITMSS